MAEGERFDVDGFDVAVFGRLHAPIHRDIPQVANVGYLIDGHVYIRVTPTSCPTPR